MGPATALLAQHHWGVSQPSPKPQERPIRGSVHWGLATSQAGNSQVTWIYAEPPGVVGHQLPGQPAAAPGATRHSPEALRALHLAASQAVASGHSCLQKHLTQFAWAGGTLAAQQERCAHGPRMHTPPHITTNALILSPPCPLCSPSAITHG